MQLHALLNTSITEAATVVRGVEPEQLGAATPCADWNVRTLTNHLLQVVYALRLAGQGQPVPGEVWARELLSDGWADRFDEEGRAASAAWAEASAWDGTARLGEMEMPAAMLVTMLVGDLAIHGWDLARATGQEYRWDPEIAETTCRFVTDMGEQGRQMGLYATPLPVADDAPASERVLALSGRDPHWTPPTP